MYKPISSPTLSQDGVFQTATPDSTQPLCRSASVTTADVQNSIHKMIDGELTPHIQRLMSGSRYTEAAEYGTAVWRRFSDLRNTGSNYVRLVFALFTVYWAPALIYIQHITEGIALLTDIISKWEGGRESEVIARLGNPLLGEGLLRNLVLGLAHNHLGYVAWMEQMRLDPALGEFRAALSYFCASNLSEEYANACDCMGRVYIEQGKRSQARKWINKGLALRRKLLAEEYSPLREYRLALSLNSLATFYLAFDRPEKADNLGIQALDICRRLEKQRGIGLVDITLGGAQQLMADHASTYDQRVQFLRQAERYFVQAIAIFQPGVVNEPVRLTKAQDELRRVHRDLDALTTEQSPDAYAVSKVPATGCFQWMPDLAREGHLMHEQAKAPVA